MEELEQVYSYSRLTTHAECPRKYRLKYLDRVKESFRSIEAHLGHAVHAALAWLYTTRESAFGPDRRSLLDKFDAEWSNGLDDGIKLIRRDDSFEARRDAGHGMLARHYDGPYREDRMKTMATEQDLETRLDGGHRYRGIVDRLARDEAGQLHLIDYKTTRRPPIELDDEKALQLRSYGLLAMERHQADRVALTFRFLVDQTALSESLCADDIPGVVGELATRIVRAEAAEEFPPRPSGLCAWCGYREICDVSGFAPADDNVCPSCGAALRRRRGRYGEFMGCENFPRCRFSRDA